MNTQRNTLAIVLIAFGVIALLSRVSGDTGWLWMALVSAGFLYAYTRERRYGFLVVGAILAGIAGGIMLSDLWNWDGGFLVSLGVGFAAIDRIEPRSNRWPFYLGLMLIALGLFSSLADSGMFGSFWFALLLIGGGVYLLNRARSGGASERPAAVPMPQPTEAPSEAPSAVPAEPPSPPEAPAVSGYDARLAALEQWRSAQAEAEGRAPYLILTNETVALLAEHDPDDLEGVRRIRGIGPVKLERYGESLLEVLRNA